MKTASFDNYLAVDGGSPVRGKPFAPWPHFDSDHIKSVCEVLESGKVNYWTGQEGSLFEKEFAATVNRKYAVAVANGTVALELALHALQIGPGDEVIVPSRTFIASASCVVMRGAVPVMADVDRESQNITPETICRAITRKTKAIIVVHLAGWPCDMEPILKLASAHGLKVIEDCAQAQGATYKGQPIGSFGDVAAFSFCQDKIMTTGGEGGMLVTNQKEWWDRAWSFKDHGKSYEAVHHRQHPAGFRWLHESFGSNWRLTEMQSALGRRMLSQVPSWIDRRRNNAAVLTEGFLKIGALRITMPPDELGHCYYKYYTFVRPETLTDGWNRDRIMYAISGEGIPCFSGSCSEIYLEKAFPAEWRPAERLPAARELGENSLMFLVHPTLGEEDMVDTCTAVEKVMSVAVQKTMGAAAR